MKKLATGGDRDGPDIVDVSRGRATIQDDETLQEFVWVARASG